VSEVQARISAKVDTGATTNLELIPEPAFVPERAPSINHLPTAYFHHPHRDVFYVVQMNPRVRQFTLICLRVAHNAWHIDVLRKGWTRRCPVPAAQMQVMCCHHASDARSVRISFSSVPCTARFLESRISCNAIKMPLPPIVFPRQVFLLPFGHQRVQGNFEPSPETHLLASSTRPLVPI
jgi:hypothetical protein